MTKPEQRAPSRVAARDRPSRYAQVPTDLLEQVPSLRDDAEALGYYVRLYLASDSTWPDAAELPRWLAAPMEARLLAAGAIVSAGDSTYRVPLVDAMRARRAAGRAVGGTARQANARRDPVTKRFLPNVAPPSNASNSSNAGDPATPATIASNALQQRIQQSPATASKSQQRLPASQLTSGGTPPPLLDGGQQPAVPPPSNDDDEQARIDRIKAEIRADLVATSGRHGRALIQAGDQP